MNSEHINIPTADYSAVNGRVICKYFKIYKCCHTLPLAVANKILNVHYHSEKKIFYLPNSKNTFMLELVHCPFCCRYLKDFADGMSNAWPIHSECTAKLEELK